MHILFLTDNFPPEGNAPATRTFEHARHWFENGHQVSVITCHPNFPEGVVYDNYKNELHSVEMMEGIEVHRVWTYITANEGFFRRTLDYVSFGLMAFAFGLTVKRPDVVVTTSPQFFCALGGWLLAGARRLPWVFELRDIWPASIAAVGAMEKGFIYGLLEKLEMLLYRRSDRIVVVANSFRENLVQRGIPAEKIDVVLNGVDLSQYRPAPKSPHLLNEFDISGKFVVGYIGTHGMAHALQSVLDAAQYLEEEQDILFLFVGGGAEKESLVSLASKRNQHNVLFLPRQPKENMPDIWSLCDISLISLRDTPLFQKVIPSKIFESMGMGLPMILSCPEGEASAIVVELECGVQVVPENAQLLAETIRGIASDKDRLRRMANRSYDASGRFDRKKLASDMLESFERAIQKTP